MLFEQIAAMMPSDFDYFNDTLKYCGDYFLRSSQKLTAWLLLLGIIFGVIASAAFLFGLSWWSVSLWAAINAKDYVLLVESIKQFSFLLIGLMLSNSLVTAFSGVLVIEWTKWLRLDLLTKYVQGENSYIDLMRHKKQIEEPAQIIQEDIEPFIEQTIVLATSFLRSTLTFVGFVSNLWIIGGSLALSIMGFNLVIPGYLVWVAIVYTVISGVITDYVGSPLVLANNEQERLDATFRNEANELSDKAESAALDRAARFFAESLKNKVEAIYNNAYDILFIKIRLYMVQDFFSNIPMILPYLIIAPLYFAGQIELGQFMQAVTSFMEVNISLSWFLTVYEIRSNHMTSLRRLAHLDKALQEGLSCSNKNIVTKHQLVEDTISVQVDIYTPVENKSILNKLNLHLKPGQHVIITGENGLGKSTLFKIICGTWRYGTGEVKAPSADHMMFLPQKPVLPKGSMRTQLAYPDSNENAYTDEEYKDVLETIGGFEDFLNNLGAEGDWSALSDGMRQRIPIARALLRKPQWLFLDEATSAMHGKTQNEMYSLLSTRLKNTTIVSIAHRLGLAEFHHVMMDVSKNREGEAVIKSIALQSMPHKPVPSQQPRPVKPNPLTVTESKLGFYSRPRSNSDAGSYPSLDLSV